MMVSARIDRTARIEAAALTDGQVIDLMRLPFASSADVVGSPLNHTVPF
jgi:hypothetical protein